MKAVLNNESGVQKWLLAQEYNKLAQRVYRDVKVIFACDLSYTHLIIALQFILNKAKDQFQPQVGPSHLHSESCSAQTLALSIR
jgi:hypothetical protein